VLPEIAMKVFPSAEGSARYLETRRPARERGFRGWQLKGFFDEVEDVLIDLEPWASLLVPRITSNYLQMLFKRCPYLARAASLGFGEDIVKQVAR